MGTITKEIANEIMAGGYKSDQPTKIVTYNNIFNGALTYAVVTRRDDQLKYENSRACSNVKTIWTNKDIK